MAKKRISSADLNWLILQELEDIGSIPHGISLAVIHDDKDGWRVVVARRSRPLTPEGERQLAAVQRKLRLKYQLSS